MPRLVAPQWQTLRGLLAAPAVRSYTQNSAPLSKPWRAIRPLNSAIVIPSSVSDTRPDDLIEYIHPVSRQNVGSDTFCVLLVTPSFASWLSRDSDFVAKAVRRAYSRAFGDSNRRITVHTLSAIVDKLPPGRSIKTGQSTVDDAARRSLEPPVGETGFEGIAFATLPANCSVPSTSAKHPEKGAIDFMVSGATTALGPYNEVWRLPLANTVFQTGKPTTMSLSKWLLHAKEGSISLEAQNEVSHHGINVATSRDTTSTTALSIPLIPLTLPRPVQGCMGNIIRGVLGPDGTPTTASAELEKVVPRYFKARGDPAQPTTAWALVIPKTKAETLRAKTSMILSKQVDGHEVGTKSDNSLFEHMWRNPPSLCNQLIPEALAEGARLHRVLSGGGGWGKKAGLLSLDPTPMSEEIPIRMEDATSSFDGPGDFSSALTPVVQDGDAIQFFISPWTSSHPSLQTATQSYEELGNLKSMPKERTWGLELGKIPSTIDSISGGSWQNKMAEFKDLANFKPSDTKYVAVFKHSFGALSEGGLMYTRMAQRGSSKPVVALKTTVDAPFSRLWAVEMEEGLRSTPETKLSLRRTVQRPTEGLTRSNDQILHSSNDRGQATTNIVRKVIPTSISELGDATWRLRLIAEMVTTLTKEHKNIVHTIRQRQQLARENTIAVSEKTLTFEKAPIRRILLESPSPKHDKPAQVVTRMHQRSQRTLRSHESVENSTSAPRQWELKKNGDADSTQSSDEITAKPLSGVPIGSTLDYLAYKSYALSSSLRMQIARMIFMRQERSGTKNIPQTLKKHLLKLRRYNQNLFINKPHMTRRDVKEWLQKLEQRSPYSQKLWLGDHSSENTQERLQREDAQTDTRGRRTSKRTQAPHNTEDRTVRRRKRLIRKHASYTPEDGIPHGQLGPRRKFVPSPVQTLPKRQLRMSDAQRRRVASSDLTSVVSSWLK